MAITFNIPEVGWFVVHEIDSEPILLGDFIQQTESVLKNIKVGFFKNNCVGQFRLRIHTNPDCNVNYSVSNWVDIEEIADIRFWGNLRFDFNKCVLSIGKTYWVTIESSGYTRNADVSYMSYIFDNPETTNVSSGNWPTEFPLRMEIFNK